MPDIKELKYNLEDKITNSNSIIVIPHIDIDFDSLSSSIGISLIANKLDKKSFIIIDDKKFDYGIKFIISNENNEFNFITSQKYLKNYSKSDLFILSDVNKKYLITLSDDIMLPNKTFIIDHHRLDNNSVNSNNKYIFEDYSSASEVITNLLLVP